jgi:hypothetical protein
MLMIMMENQIFAPHQVCQSCVLADGTGQPRWRQGQLRCGHAIRNTNEQQPDQYECLMGFRVVHIE